MVGIQELLKKMVDEDASDLHIVAGVPPLFRVSGDLKTYSEEKLMPDDCEKLIFSVMSEEQRANYQNNHELDFSFGVSQMGRFRANCYQQRGSTSLALRLIPNRIKNMDELGLPKVLKELINQPSGLVLVTGATGSGKSTTLAAMLDEVNSTRSGHILTIEDPIEFVHRHKKCLVSQREIGTDSGSFGSALKTALRQDPDYVLIGEMRDPETMETALTISETGHLTFATLHTNSAVQTINRIVDAFPAAKQEQIRVQLSFVLQCVISQTLLPKRGEGRILATEIMVATPAIRAMIRDDKLHQIQSNLETGKKFGMHTLNSNLSELVSKGLIEQETALEKSANPEELQRLISGGIGRL